MEHCLDCNATLRKDEVSCYACGAKVPREEKQSNFSQRFATFVSISFYFSAALTVAAIFTNYAPPFTKCLISTFILLLVKGSADQMLEKKNK